MIARLRILLPFYIFRRKADRLEAVQFSSDIYQIKIYPPTQAALNPKDIDGLSPTPVRTALELLKPTDTQDETIVQIDGGATVLANLLQIDFYKPEFDRAKTEPKKPSDFFTQGNPPIQFGFDIANGFIARLRTLTRGHKVRMVSPESVPYRLDYLSDDGNELPTETGKYHRRLGSPFTVHVTALNASIWNEVHSLPTNHSPYSWDTLLLDAEALLPEVGASLVVATAALEILIEWALDRIAERSRLNNNLWRWINKRRDRFQNPSVAEQYDVLLQVFTGRSLKEVNDLWEGLKNLRDARNSYAHEGRAVLGGKDVTVELASELLAKAKRIAEWVESLLPEDLKRPIRRGPISIEVVKPVQH